MAQEKAKMHDTGDFFPVLEFKTTTGETIVLPGDVIGKWSVILFYRGHWCPYCRRQLQDFQKHIDDFGSAGIEVIAASSDSEDNARKTVEEFGVTFKVGWGLDAREVSSQTGAFYNKEKGHLHATGYILAPDGMIAEAVYSTGPVGRLVAQDTLALIKYLREKKG